eukprot:4356321-Prymnesium_polylepis.1
MRDSFLLGQRNTKATTSWPAPAQTRPRATGCADQLASRSSRGLSARRARERATIQFDSAPLSGHGRALWQSPAVPRPSHRAARSAYQRRAAPPARLCEARRPALFRYPQCSSIDA